MDFSNSSFQIGILQKVDVREKALKRLPMVGMCFTVPYKVYSIELLKWIDVVKIYWLKGKAAENWSWNKPSPQW